MNEWRIEVSWRLALVPVAVLVMVLECWTGRFGAAADAANRFCDDVCWIP